MKHLTSKQKLDAVDQALAKVESLLASGTLDQSGRYYTDAQLAAGAATGHTKEQEAASEVSAA